MPAGSRQSRPVRRKVKRPILARSAAERAPNRSQKPPITVSATGADATPRITSALARSAAKRKPPPTNGMPAGSRLRRPVRRKAKRPILARFAAERAPSRSQRPPITVSAIGANGISKTTRVRVSFAVRKKLPPTNGMSARSPLRRPVRRRASRLTPARSAMKRAPSRSRRPRSTSPERRRRRNTGNTAPSAENFCKKR